MATKVAKTPVRVQEPGSAWAMFFYVIVVTGVAQDSTALGESAFIYISNGVAAVKKSSVKSGGR